MNRFWIVVLFVCTIPCIGMAQDTLLFGDGDCYKYQEYEGDAYETRLLGYYNFEFTIDTGRAKWLPDKNYWIVMQQYSDCDIIYGVSGLLGIGRIWFTNWDGGGIRTFSGEEREHISDFCEIYFVLGQKDSNGNFSIIDSVQWYPDSIDHYLQLRWNENVIAYYPVNDLYFENPHTFYGKNDTIGVGVYIKQKDGIIDYPIYKIGATIEFWLRCVQNEQDSVVWYSDPQRLVSRINNTYYYSIETSNSDSIPPKNHSGGFFPITCPKPEGPVEDTVGNGIRDVSYLNSNISIYPNPATDFITINCDNMQKAVIYNSLGQQALSFTTNKADISTLPNGIYFLKVFTTSNILTRKLVIQK